MTGFKILQWNMNGFINNFSELQLLIKEHNPDFLSIQETHCKFDFTPIPPKGYIAYFYNIQSNTTSKQGICVLIKNKFHTDGFRLTPHFKQLLSKYILILNFQLYPFIFHQPKIFLYMTFQISSTL